MFTGQPRQSTKVIPTLCYEDLNPPKEISRLGSSAPKRVIFRTSKEAMNAIWSWPAPKL